MAGIIRHRGPRRSDGRLHALSFDVEEYFQVANLRSHFARDDWDKVPSRLSIGMDAILSALDRHDAHATFFFLGWIAERHPHYVRRCIDAGHEVASHGYEHTFLQDIATKEALVADLARTETALVAAGAPKPRGFRASTFTLTRATWWAFDVLVERGYTYDSSIHPIRHPTYGVPDFDPGISSVQTERGSIVEFPVSTVPMFGRNWPVGGGGYFRLLGPYNTAMALRLLERRARPGAIYMHPWEFDPEQPRCPAAFHKRFRHYLNLKKTLPWLEQLMGKFRFGTMEAVIAEGMNRSEGDTRAM
jgi:polysaccharide deacetylase family protein (PEP-CTERM system associated)